MDRIAASHAFQTGRMVRFIGVSCGVKCDFPVRISSFHPSLPEYYSVAAVFADNVLYTPTSWVRLDELDSYHADDLEHKG